MEKVAVGAPPRVLFDPIESTRWGWNSHESRISREVSATSRFALDQNITDIPALSLFWHFCSIPKCNPELHSVANNNQEYIES